MTLKITQLSYKSYPGDPIEIEYTITNDWGTSFYPQYKLRLDPNCNFYGSDYFNAVSGSLEVGETFTGTFMLNTVQYDATCYFDINSRIIRVSDGKEVSDDSTNFSIITDYLYDAPMSTTEKLIIGGIIAATGLYLLTKT